MSLPPAQGHPELGHRRGPQASYTLYHPKWYRRRISVWWWLEGWASTKFVLRELTSVPVAFFALVLLWQVSALGEGPEAYARFLAWMRMPLFLVLNTLAFLAILFHAITWFNLAPKAMVIRLGGKRIPEFAIAGLNYAGWLVASWVVAWLLLRG